MPTGVPSPPTDAANEFDNRSAVPKPAGSAAPSLRASSAAKSETPIGNIIAVVAVLLIHMEIAHATAA